MLVTNHRKGLNSNLFKYFFKVLAVTVWLFCLPYVVVAFENIPLYDVELTPRSDGTVLVVETIHYDFARNYRHGITRTIPLQHPQESSAFYKERYIDIEIISATLDGDVTPYEASIANDELFLKIGDPDITMTTEHGFTLTYVVSGGLHYYPDGLTELYWDAIGTQSQVPTGQALVKINDVEGLTTGAATCYVGAARSEEICTIASSTYRFAYTVSDLEPFQGVTVAVALADTVPEVILERTNIWYFVLPGGLISLFAFLLVAYRYKTAHRTKRSIIAQYEPYADAEPMYTGVLLDDRLDPKDITACIVYLAQQGYLTIKKTEAKVLFFFEVDDYEITLLREVDEQLSRFQRDVLGLLFKTIASGEKVSLSKLKSDMSKQRDNQLVLSQLRTDLKKDMVDKGYFQNLDWARSWPTLALLAGMVAVTFFLLWPLGILFTVLILIFLIISRRRTQKGYEALYHLKGFEDFLSTTEKDRYKFHNAPTKSPEQFMQFLPFAIALGVEKEWAEVFKDITIPNPEWYDGGSSTAFSAVNLSSSLGAFSTAFASSSGSSGSGSSGGGSTGGGGGGGSVGSW